MAAEAKQSCYEGSGVQSFQFYLEKSGEHEAILQCVQSILPGEFKRIGAGKSGLDVLGVGSGGGELDVQMLSVLQSTFPALPITADIVEGSSQLSDNFKALVSKTTNLQKITFAWHVMHSEDYEKQVKAKGDVKKFDFIHMIQMIYYVNNLAETIKFYHSLLKNNGRLMIIIETAKGGWDTLWKTYKKELCIDAITEYRSSAEVLACLKSQGLKYEEHIIHNTFDITECFDTSSATGERLLNFMTARDHFYQSFTPEIRAGMLDLLRNKCSTEKDGRCSCVSIQRRHLNKGLRHSGTTRLSYFEGSFNCSREMCPSFPWQQRIQQVDPWQLNLSQDSLRESLSKEFSTNKAEAEDE